MMGRDHIDFIQAQRLPWREADEFGFPGCRLKMLSSEREKGAYSAILRLPTGWRRLPRTLSFDEELYVLDGALSIGGNSYDENAYAFMPAGSGPHGLAVREDTTLLYFRSGVVEEPLRSDAAKIAAREVRKIDVSEGEWDGDFDKFGLGSMKAGARMRVLREDPFSGETTYVTATIAFRRGERAERHPNVQEFFLLAGELAGELGVMQTGAYCFRPPLAKHGPYGSPTGALILFRSLGGRQETFWEDADPFTFRPDHKPILPDGLKPFGAPFPRPPRY